MKTTIWVMIVMFLGVSIAMVSIALLFMKKLHSNRRFFLFCAALMGAGVVLSVSGVAMGGTVKGIRWNDAGLHVYAPQLLSDRTYEEKEERLNAFQSIEINLDYADIRLEASESDEYEIAYCLEAGADIQYEVSDGKLVFSQKNSNYGGSISWFSFGSGSFNEKDGKNEYVKLRIPKGAKLSAVDLKTDFGNTFCKNIQADSLNIDAAYGNVDLKYMYAGKLKADMDSGDCTWMDVAFENCKINAEYGDVRLRLSGSEADYWYKLKTEYGNVILNGEDFGGSLVMPEKEKGRTIKITCGSGDIKIDSQE